MRDHQSIAHGQNRTAGVLEFLFDIARDIQRSHIRGFGKLIEIRRQPGVAQLSQNQGDLFFIDLWLSGSFSLLRTIPQQAFPDIGPQRLATPLAA